MLREANRTMTFQEKRVQAELARMMRDVNAGAAHYAFTDDLSAPNYGRALLGLPPAKTNTFV